MDYAATKFESKTERSPSGCWIWAQSLGTAGYGQVSYQGKLIGAHRAAWMIYRGSIPSGLFVCHKCDVKTCVNPDHLFLGSPLSNMQDMIAKKRDRSGRMVQGTKIAKLSTEQVRDIRRSPLSFAQLAKAYGVSRGCIQAVKQRRSWKHADAT